MEKALDGSKDKLKAQDELNIEIAHRKHVDQNIHFIHNLFFRRDKLHYNDTYSIRQTYIIISYMVILILIFKSLSCTNFTHVKTYERHCGILSTHGMKYSRVFANMCNVGIYEKQMIATISQVCSEKKHFS